MVKKQVAARKTEILKSKGVLNIDYSSYENHRVERENREKNEYKKIQDEHIQCCEIARMSQGIRERIISTYKAEIESNKYLRGDFSGLEAIVMDL